MSREPAIIIGALEGLGLALLGVVIIVAKIEPTLAGALVGVVGAGIAVLSSLFVRSKVKPVA